MNGTKIGQPMPPGLEPMKKLKCSPSERHYPLPYTRRLWVYPHSQPRLKDWQRKHANLIASGACIATQHSQGTQAQGTTALPQKMTTPKPMHSQLHALSQEGRYPRKKKTDASGKSSVSIAENQDIWLENAISRRAN